MKKVPLFTLEMSCIVHVWYNEVEERKLFRSLFFDPATAYLASFFSSPLKSRNHKCDDRSYFGESALKTDFQGSLK